MSDSVWKQRESLGIAVDLVASAVGISPEELLEWERRQVVPRKLRRRLDLAVWSRARDILLERSGLPECKWISSRDFENEDDLKALPTHLEGCELCRVRAEYVESRIGDAPVGATGRAVARLAAISERLSDWQRAAVGGAFVLIVMAGIGVVILLGLAVINLDGMYALQAGGLLIVLTVSGAAGGITHHATKPWRGHKLGHYAAAVLTVGAYFLTVLALVFLAGTLLGWENVDPEMEEMVTEPAGWIIALVLVVIFGLLWGRSTRDELS